MFLSHPHLHNAGRVALFLLAAAGGSVDAREPAGLRFDTPGVLDLSAHELKDAKPAAAGIPTRTLAADTATAILAAPPVEQDGPVVRMVGMEAGCADLLDACVRKYESKRIAAESSAVARTGKRLLIKPNTAAPLAFVDFSRPAGKAADGDSATHIYAGRFGKAGYHRVEIQFGHDAPGSFLVSSADGKVAFVHNGGDIAALSPDGSRMVVVNLWSQPVYVRIAQLDDAGPSVELQCGTGDSQVRISASFKGWQGDDALDLVLAPESGNPRDSSAVPLRLEFADGRWTQATPDPERLQKAMGWICRG